MTSFPSRIRVWFPVVAVLLIAAVPRAIAGGPTPPGVDPLIPGRAIVKVDAQSTIDQFLAVINVDFPLKFSVIDAMPQRRLYLLQHTPIAQPQLDQLENALETTYVNQGLLEYGELLYEGKAPEGSTGSIWVTGLTTFSTFAGQYAVDKTGLPAAQARSTGSGTVVAVIDTGVDATHPVLSQRMTSGGYNFITNSANTTDVGDGVDNDGDGATDEMVGHGTYVAGLIALTAPNAKILPVTVLNSDGVGDLWTLGKGMFHAIDRGVEVMNLSLTSTYDSMMVIDAVLEAASRGIVVVAAAGNWNRDEPREYPAMDDDIPVIGVAATDDHDVKGGFSNYNERLYLSAPGANIENNGVPVAAQSMVGTLPNGEFGFSEGTSMAVPLVSGAAALIRAQHPEWPSAASTVDTIRLRLRTTAVDINSQNPAYAGELGHGRVDIQAAVELGPIAPFPGDVNNDGSVNVFDLLTVINDWGLVHSSADFNGDGTVNVSDLLTVIQNWG